MILRKYRSNWKHGMPVEDERWNKFHRDVFGSADYLRLSRTAKVLLIDMFTQWNGYNNGQIPATMSILSRDFRWPINATRSLREALSELIAAGLIETTRKHSRARSALYRLTWITNSDNKK